MAFRRYASAVLMQPHVSQRGWSKVRTAAIRTGGVTSQSLINQATEILSTPFDPDRYLLSHATIVASVDVEPVPNIKTGRVVEQGKTINRKWADYRILPESDAYINNNFDAWSREVLLKSYRTFIGGHSFLEHVQIEEQSKGRILDAVARDIGPSVYIDILVANDRVHTQLVRDILSGKMSTLSMGCTVELVQCTKCGNVAVDETDMCDHIRYEKGNYFHDDMGNRRRIAELCGHPSIDETAGVTFIEASWVGAPAFAGAALRNVLRPQNISPRQARHIQEVLSQPPREWDSTSRTRAASVVVGKISDRKVAFEFGDGEEDGGEDSAPAATAAPANPLQGIEDELHQVILDRVKDRLKQELTKEDLEDAINPEDSTAAPNDTIIKEGGTTTKHVRLAARRVQYNIAAAALIKTSSSDADLLNRLVHLDRGFGLEVDPSLYRAALRVGSAHNYTSLDQFLVACSRALGGSLDHKQTKTMLRLGKTISALENSNPKETQS